MSCEKTKEEQQRLQRQEDGEEEEDNATEATDAGVCRNALNYVKGCEEHNVISLVIAIAAIVTLITIGVDECRSCFEEVENHRVAGGGVGRRALEPKIYKIFAKNTERGHLKNVFLVLERLGHENDQNASDWDLLWAHDYPFRALRSELGKLKPHQRVNHFPGCGHITNKVDLATAALRYVPPAFKLPEGREDFLEYRRLHPGAIFVRKNNDHRNIKVVKRPEEIGSANANGTFVQEFVDKPFLVGGYKFDVGIYTVITSVDPLRVYVYNGEALLRFCPVKYYPFDPDNLDKYVVGDDYLPIWKVPELDYFYNKLGFSMKETLNAFLRSKGRNPSVIWDQIEDAIRTAILAKEPAIVDVVNRFPSKRNFFELMRVDFAVDEDLKVYLMEANMSPNLSSAHYPPNQLIYEQVLFNVFGLIGVGGRIRKSPVAARPSAGEEEMQSAFKNVAVFPAECGGHLCRKSCLAPECQLCSPCLTPEAVAVLKEAHREHLNRGDCKRIFPPPMTQETAASFDDLEELSAENRLMHRWFQGKCLQDVTWCV